jgi:ATP-dependent Clp protease protease subunit
MLKGRKKPTTSTEAPTGAPGSPADNAYMNLYVDTLLERGIDIEKRTITIEGDVEEGWFTFMDASLSLLESLDESPITIRISSGGGMEYAGWSVVGRMHRSPCEIVVEGYGYIMSMATIILAAGNKRRLSKYANWMYHSCSYGVEGRHPQVKNFVKQNEKEELRAAKFMAERSKKPVNFWKKLGYDVDAYMTPEEVLELGVIDEIF